MGLLTQKSHIKKEERDAFLSECLIVLENKAQSEPVIKEAGAPFLQECSLEKVYEVIHDERPQLIALICFYLGRERGRSLLNLFNHDQQVDIRERMTTLRPVVPEILKTLHDAIVDRIANLELSGLDKQSKRSLLSRLFGKGQEKEAQFLLSKIKEENPAAFRHLQALITPFEQLVKLPDQHIVAAIKDIPISNLAIALKVASAVLRNKFLNLLTDPQKTELLNHINESQSASVKEIEEAQEKIVEIILESNEETYVEAH